MLKKLLAAMSVMTFVAAAGAAGRVSFVQVDNSDAATLTDVAVDPIAWDAAGYLTYDLVFDSQGEAWTTAYCHFTLTGATFWDHPNGDVVEMAPDPANFPSFGLTRYDSFYTGYNTYPTLGGDTSGPPAAAPGSPIQNTPAVREMEWYDSSPYDNVGTFTIARFTILPLDYIWQFDVTGTTTTREDLAAAPFEITITPEPTGLAFLIFGALAAARRR